MDFSLKYMSLSVTFVLARKCCTLFLTAIVFNFSVIYLLYYVQSRSSIADSSTYEHQKQKTKTKQFNSTSIQAPYSHIPVRSQLNCDISPSRGFPISLNTEFGTFFAKVFVKLPGPGCSKHG